MFKIAYQGRRLGWRSPPATFPANVVPPTSLAGGTLTATTGNYRQPETIVDHFGLRSVHCRTNIPIIICDYSELALYELGLQIGGR